MKMQVRSFITQNFFDFSYFFCRNRNRMHLLVYIHSSALALAHTLGFLNEKLILGRKITLIFYVPWSVKMRLIHLDPPKISESAFFCQKYPPKANSSSSFFFLKLFSLLIFWQELLRFFFHGWKWNERKKFVLNQLFKSRLQM